MNKGASLRHLAACCHVASLYTPPRVDLLCRHQWFQINDTVEVNVLAKGVAKENVSVQISEQQLRVVLLGPTGEEEFDLNVQLWDKVSTCFVCRAVEWISTDVSSSWKYDLTCTSGTRSVSGQKALVLWAACPLTLELHL